MSFPVPENEAARLDALRSYDILDTVAEDDFDDITRIASALCGTPISMISLLDGERQWFKSRVGFNAPETHRDLAFCAHAILQTEMMVVPNVREDARFADNSLVTGAPHIRFYAGAPLITPCGHALGTLCVIDREPRDLTPLQREVLQILARQVMAQLELRRKIKTQTLLLATQQRMEQQLRDSHTRFEAFMNTGPLVAFMKDANGRFLYVNKPFERLFNVTLEDIWGTTDMDWFPPDVAEQIRRNDAIVLQSGQALETIENVPTADGEQRSWTVYKFPFTDPSDQPCVGGVAVDITPRTRAEEALRRSEARYIEAQRIAEVGSWEFDIASRAIRWSEETFRLMDFDPAQGEPSYEAVVQRYHPEDAPLLNKCLQQCIQDGKPYSCEVRVLLHNGSQRWLHVLGQAERNAQDNSIRLFGTVRNRSRAKAAQKQMEATNAKLEAANTQLESANRQLEAANAQLKALATTDGLTGLKNHRSFQEKLAVEFERSRRYHMPLAVMLLDVDKFKMFNDTFGHPAGDEILKRVARVLQHTARLADFVARYGGEEFVIVLPETDTAGAMCLAERIRAGISGEVWEQHVITVSIGVASLQITTPDTAVLLEEADKALYQSKQNGRNQVTLAGSC